LEDKISGRFLPFNIYNNKDIHFLNPKNESSSLIRDNIIDGDADDDCQTDDEQRDDAKDMAKNELKNAINKFL
jgi:hypothetical protein